MLGRIGSRGSDGRISIIGIRERERVGRWTHRCVGAFVSFVLFSGLIAVTSAQSGAISSSTFVAQWSPAVPITSNQIPDNYFYSVSCVSTTFCLAVGEHSNFAEYNGTNWFAPTSSPAADLVSISCASTTFCMSTDGSNAYVYDGSGWLPYGPIGSAGTSSVVSVSCPTSSFCAAVDAIGNAYTFNGSSWTTSISADPSGYGFESLSCTSSSFCMAGGGGNGIYEYNGSTWTKMESLSSLDAGIQVSCSSSSSCVAVDGGGNTYTFNGTAWSSALGISSPSLLVNLDCVSSTFCVGVDSLTVSTAAAYNFNGSAWSQSNLFTGPHANATGISCVSTTFCVAVGNNAYSWFFNGSTWQSFEVTTGTSLTSVSCPTATFCITGDVAGNVYSFNGTSWSGATNIAGTNQITAISCASVSLCFASDSAGNVYSFNGTSWSVANNIAGSYSISALTCASASLCVAGDTNGDVYIYNGTSWSTPDQISYISSSPNIPYAITSISCSNLTSSTFCDAGSSVGTYVYNGSTWTNIGAVTDHLLGSSCINGLPCMRLLSCVSGTEICFGIMSLFDFVESFNNHWNLQGGTDIGSPLARITSLSCPATNFCEAVDSKGFATYYNGSVWSGPVDLSSPSALNGVSCVSSSFCMAVDPPGNAYKFTVPPVKSSTSISISSSNPAPLFGQSNTITVRVSSSQGVPTGSVDISVNSNFVATEQLTNGVVSLTTSDLPPGTDKVSVSYAGDPTHFGSSASISLVVGFSQPCYTGTHHGHLAVDSGDAVCFAPGSIQDGSIELSGGASIYLDGASIHGSISSNGASAVMICGSQADGTLSVIGSSAFVQVGGDADDVIGCSPNQVAGSLVVQNNTGGVEVSDNAVSGNGILSNNSGSGLYPEDVTPETESN